MRRVVLLILATAFVSSCASLDPSYAMKSWVGHSVAELVGSWGPPQVVMDDQRYKGCKVFVYTAQRQVVLPASSNTYTSATLTGWGNYAYLAGTSTTYYTPAQVSGYTAVRTFYVDAGGEVYAWSWKGY